LQLTVCIKNRFNVFYTVLPVVKKGVREVRGQIFTIILNYFVFLFGIYIYVTYICSVIIKQLENMTTLNNLTPTEKKVSKLENGYKVWDSLSPMERYNKVMKNFTPSERKGVNGLRKMAQYIIDNNITK